MKCRINVVCATGVKVFSQRLLAHIVENLNFVVEQKYVLKTSLNPLLDFCGKVGHNSSKAVEG